MVQGLFGFNHREAAMDELFPSESSKQANLSAELSSLPPLNLTLRKTPSFLNLLKSKLSNHDSSHYQTITYSQTSCGAASQRAPEKLKASNFPASLLQIGSWQEVSRNEADLVAKCYYSKKKLVWEVLRNGLKSKIEIQWSDISAIRATLQEDHPGILEIELDNAPTFYQESNPQPRKHTIWHMTTDFTDGQASLHRRHYIKFPPGVLDRHYEKLLQNDQRLLELSRKGFPSHHHSPCFNWTPYQYHLDYSYDPSPHELKPQIDFRTVDPRESTPYGLTHHQLIQTHQPAFDPATYFDNSTASAMSGPSQFQENMIAEYSSSSDDHIASFNFGDTGTASWDHGINDFVEDQTFYGTITTEMPMPTVDMGMPGNFQQNLYPDPTQYSYNNLEMNPARPFQGTSYGNTDFSTSNPMQFDAMNTQTCPQFAESSSMPSQFSDENFTMHQYGNAFNMYPPYSLGF